MSFRIVSSCLALVLLAPAAMAANRAPPPVVRDHRPAPVVNDHRASPVVRDHRLGVRDHRGGASSTGGVKVGNGRVRKVECLGNLC